MTKENILFDPEEFEILKEQLYASEYPKLIDDLTLPKYTISDLKISPRDATYWDKQGVLPTVKGTGTRRKYDLTQSVWLKLVQQMRSLGIGLKTIQGLKEYLLEPKVDLSSLSPKVIELLTAELKKNGLKLTSEEYIATLLNEGLSVFQNVILATIIFRKSFHCLINKDSDFVFYDAFRHYEFLNTQPEFEDFVSKPYFSVSFSEAIKVLCSDWLHIKPLKELTFLSKNESKIIEMIRRKDVNSISIRYKDGEPDLLEVEERNEISMEQRFLDVITKNGYQKISVSTQNGKIVNFENKIQMKLNKRTK
jgi:DNA-binding transcriptional MerR regulator